jgi:hypothetical protein
MRALKFDDGHRIAVAERAARLYLATLPTQTVEELGVGSIISDLTREFLLNGIPNDEELLRLDLLSDCE